jgi:hypothetical protein
MQRFEPRIAKPRHGPLPSVLFAPQSLLVIRDALLMGNGFNQLRLKAYVRHPLKTNRYIFGLNFHSITDAAKLFGGDHC